jgi:hypothetical protein
LETFLIKKNSNFIGAIYRKRSLISYDCRKNLYFALVHSRIIYGIEVYGSAQKTLLSSLMISCNRVLRVLQEKQRRYPVHQLYLNFKAMSINNAFKFSILKLMYKCYYMKSTVPSVIHSLFTLNNSLHDHNTRSNALYHMYHNFSAKSGSGVFLASYLWNSLPVSVRQCNSFPIFKKKLKLHLMSVN